MRTISWRRVATTSGLRRAGEIECSFLMEVDLSCHRARVAGALAVLRVFRVVLAEVVERDELSKPDDPAPRFCEQVQGKSLHICPGGVLLEVMTNLRKRKIRVAKRRMR